MVRTADDGGPLASELAAVKPSPKVSSPPALVVPNVDELKSYPFEVWTDAAGQTFLVWMTDALNEGDAPIPIAYRVPDPTAFDDIFGEGATLSSIADFTKVRTFDASSGVVVLGTTNLIPNGSLYEDNQFDTFLELYEKQAETQPWLRDPEILALVVGTELIEDRTLTPEEWSQTRWWQEHSASERAWLTLVNSDPSTANQALTDQRLSADKLLRSLGVNNPDSALVNFVADKVTQGSWTATYANQQIGKLADPFAPGKLDGELRVFDGVDTTRKEEDTVRQLITDWLGPRFSNGWSPEWVQQWAGKLRNDPDAEQELVERLRQHRLAMYPTYQDPTLSYEDIAGPWRSVFSEVWGQVADETDPIFGQVLQLNDLGKAQTLLRSEGLKRGNTTVTNNALQGLAGAFGQPIRRTDEALR